MNKNHRINHSVRTTWIAALATALYLYFFERSLIEQQFSAISQMPMVWRYWIYFGLGCLRGFTLIPVTYLIVLGLLFLPATSLFLLTISGIAVSSLVIYYFAEFIHLGEIFERKYPKQIAKLKSVMQKNELPIVALWSFFPLAPTDVICYVCGSLEVSVKKLLLGVLIGEGLASGLYIFLGKEFFLFFFNKI